MPMMTIDQYRKAYPQFNQMSDEELTSRLFEKYGNGKDLNTFATHFNGGRTWGEFAQDQAVNVAQSGVGLVNMIAGAGATLGIPGADTMVEATNYARDEMGKRFHSESLQRKQAELSQAVEGKNDDGTDKAFFENSSDVLGFVAENPAMLADLTMQNIGSLVGGAAVGIATKGSALALGAYQTLLGAGDGYSSTQERILQMKPEELAKNSKVFRELLEQGLTVDEAHRQVAGDAAQKAGYMTGAISGVLAKFGGVALEKQLGEAANQIGTRVTAGMAGKAMGKEIATEFGEEAGVQLSGNVAIKYDDLNPEQGLMQGVGGSGALGAAASVTPSGVMGGANMYMTRNLPTQAELDAKLKAEEEANLLAEKQATEKLLLDEALPNDADPLNVVSKAELNRTHDLEAQSFAQKQAELSKRLESQLAPEVSQANDALDRMMPIDPELQDLAAKGVPVVEITPEQSVVQEEEQPQIKMYGDKPFQTEQSAKISQAYKTTPNAVVIPVDGGYGVVDDVKWKASQQAQYQPKPYPIQQVLDRAIDTQKQVEIEAAYRKRDAKLERQKELDYVEAQLQALDEEHKKLRLLQSTTPVSNNALRDKLSNAIKEVEAKQVAQEAIRQEIMATGNPRLVEAGIEEMQDVEVPELPMAITPDLAESYAPKMPENFADDRLLDEAYRVVLGEVFDNTTKGGGVSLVPVAGTGYTGGDGNEYGQQMTRTKSINHPITQALIADGYTAEEVKAALDASLKGQKFGKRWQGLVAKALDYSNTDAADIRASMAEFEQAKTAELGNMYGGLTLDEFERLYVEPKPVARRSLVRDLGEVIEMNGGYVDVQFKDTKYSPRSQSIVDFQVEEDKRGQGIGKALLRKAIAKYPDLGGQASSYASIKAMYDVGFRHPANPNATLEELFAIKDDMSSVYMALNDTDGVPYVLGGKESQKPVQEVEAQPEHKEAASESVEAPVANTEAQAKSLPQERIDDVGESIAGAKKMTFKFTDALAADVDIASVPLSKSFPKPDYVAMAKAGADNEVLSLVAMLRDEIPAKPKVAYRLKSWVSKVESAREIASQLMENATNGTLSLQRVYEVFAGADKILKPLVDVALLASNVKPEQIETLSQYRLRTVQGKVNKSVMPDYDAAILADDTEDNGLVKGTFFQVENVNNNRERAYFLNYANAQQYILDAVQAKSESTSGEKRVDFGVFSVRGQKGYQIGKKVSSGKFITLETGIASIAEAKSMIANDYERLKAKYDAIKDVPSERKAINNPRIGEDYRNGREVTAAEFAETFGFRGVQFGNYVDQGKRQEDLNNAYDGFMDLAGIIGVPPKALSLNGELGMAFGARGSGGKNPAKAHYEPDMIVINMTKANGSGSLAHEWFHALDNYFSRLDNEKGKMDFASEKANPMARPEVMEAWKNLRLTIKNETQLFERSIALDSGRSKDYWSTVLEMIARSFERYVIDKLAEKGFESDYLANIIDAKEWDALQEVYASMGIDKKPYPYPLDAEAEKTNAAYDALFDAIETKVVGDKVVLFSFAGRKAKTANLDNLANAEVRIAAGEDAEVVRQETGWHQGVDGKWRFEIDDSVAKLKVNVLNADEVNEHQTKIDSLKNTLAGILARDDLTNIEKQRAKSNADVRLKMLEQAAPIKKIERALTKRVRTIGELLDHPELLSAYPSVGEIKVAYSDDAIGRKQEKGEYGSYNPETNEIRLNVNLDQKEILSTLMHEIQHAIQEEENFARGGSSSTLSLEQRQAAINEIEQEAMNMGLPSYERKLNDYVSGKITEDEYNNYLWDVASATKEYGMAGYKFELYQRLAGEVEARNTQKRLGMSAQERKLTAPSATQDVPNEKQIVRFDGGRAEMAVSQAQFGRTGNKPNDFITADGSIDFWIVPEFTNNKTAAEYPSKPVRLKVGAQYGNHNGFGEKHIAEQRKKFLNDIGMSAERYVHSLLNSAYRIYAEGNGVLQVEAYGEPKGKVVVELRDEGDYYSVVTAYDTPKKHGSLIWSGRRPVVSFEQNAVSSKVRNSNESSPPLVGSLEKPSPLNGTQGVVNQDPALDALGANRNKQNTTTTNLTKQQATDIISQDADGKRLLKNKKLKVLGSIDEASDNVQDQITLSDADGNIQGFFDPATDTAYLVADALTADTINGVLVHEVGVHAWWAKANSEKKAALEKRAMQLLNQGKYGNEKIKAFYAAVEQRMIDADVQGNAEEAAAYIVEEAINQASYALSDMEVNHNDKAQVAAAIKDSKANMFKLSDSRLIDWVAKNISQSLASFLSDFISSVRASMHSIGWLKTANLTGADLVAIAKRNMRDVATSNVVNSDNINQMKQSKKQKAPRTTWGAGFPDVVFASKLGSAEKHQDYNAAKGGDIEAAIRLVDDLVSNETVDRIAKMIGDLAPDVVPVLAIEANGNNMIPNAYANKIAAELGLDVDYDIVQSEKVGRTGKGSDYRLAYSPKFDGNVTKKSYLIVDDTMAMGGTLANLKGHIESNGGNVIGATTLTGYGGVDGYGDGVLALSEKMRQNLWKKHGISLDDYLKSEFGYGIDSLTQGEAGHYNKAKSVDEIRARISAARNEASGDDGASLLSIDQKSGHVKFSNGGNSVAVKQPTFTVPEFTIARKAQQKLQDSFNRIKQIQDAIVEQGGKVAPTSDVYKAEERFWGKVGSRASEFQHAVKKLIGSISESNIDLGDMEEYLYARHAGERNQYIRTNVDANNMAGSGMTDAQAAQIMQKMEAKHKGIDKLADRFDAMIAETRKIQYESGLISLDTFNKWSEYKHYVPLKGFADDDLAAEFAQSRLPVGKGFDVRGAESKKAGGRTTLAAQLIENMYQQRLQAIARAGKNEVTAALFNLVNDNPNSDLWEINAITRSKSSKEGVAFLRFATQQERDDYLDNMGISNAKIDFDGNVYTAEFIAPVGFINQYFDQKDTVATKIGGKTVYIKIKDEALLDQMSRAGIMSDLGPLEIAAAMQNMLKRFYTSLNPEFTAINFMRDLMTAFVAMPGETGKFVDSAKFVKNLTVIGSAVKYAYGKQDANLAPEMKDLVNRYLENGGSTGFMDFKDIGMLSDSVNKMWLDARKAKDAGLMDKAKTMSRLAWDKTAGNIERANEGLEMATRLAAFKTAIESGKTDREAAAIAKNITVNFNRKGDWARGMDLPFMFFNPAIQGTVRVLEIASKPKSAAMLGGLIALGLFTALVSGGDDDEEGNSKWDLIPDENKMKTLPFLGLAVDGGFGQIQMPYGVNFFTSIGYALGDVYRWYDSNGKRGKSPEEAAEFTAKAMATHLNAFGGMQIFEGGLATVQAVTPAMLDPVVQVGGNVSWTGKALRPEDTFKKGKNDATPDSQKFFAGQEDNPETRIVGWLSRTTGGDGVKAGLIEIAPSTLNATMQAAFGGVWSMGKATYSAIGKAANPNEAVEAKDIPIVRKMVGGVTSGMYSAAYREKADEVKGLMSQYDNYIKAGRFAEARAFYNENVNELEDAGKVKAYDKQLKSLRTQRNMIFDNRTLTDAERQKRLTENKKKVEEVLKKAVKAVE